MEKLLNIELLTPLYDQITSMAVGFIKILPMLGIGIFVLAITWAISKAVSKILRKSLSHTKMRPSLKSLFATLAKVAVWTFGIMITATVVFPSLTPAKMLATLGLGSVAIGFAFKDVFENFLAGILIMLRDPMRIGDYIECEGVEGRVEHISIRETYIRETDDELVLVPNSYLFKNPLTVVTDKALRRFEITAGVGYGEDVDKCREIIQNAVEGAEFIEKDKPVQVFAKEFGDSSINYTVRWWSQSAPVNKHKSRDKVISAIKRALDEAGVEIPFPYRTMTFSEPLIIKQDNDRGKDSQNSQDKGEKQAGAKK
ncbi:MAG: mechanosensitive ion channel [Alphaproteobacteria bacterium]|nr:mechanosensitive ion channel [Alphaproteobacteria bacterium]